MVAVATRTPSRRSKSSHQTKITTVLLEPPVPWGADEEADLPEFLQGADDKEVFDYDTALSGYNVEWQDR